MIRRFWWSVDGAGLCFKRFKDINTSLIFKLAWFLADSYMGLWASHLGSVIQSLPLLRTGRNSAMRKTSSEGTLQSWLEIEVRWRWRIKIVGGGLGDLMTSEKLRKSIRNPVNVDKFFPKHSRDWDRSKLNEYFEEESASQITKVYVSPCLS